MHIRLLAAVVAVGAVAVAAAAAFGAFTSGTPSAAGAPHGIAVKGAWKVAVKNPDGRIVRVHRFHNAFNGAVTIAPILAHRSTTGRYWLTLSDQTGGGQHPCGDATAASCFLFEPDDPNAGIPGWFGNLSVTSTSSPAALTIRGEIEATRAGSFNHVRMLLSTCGGGATAPNDCKPGSYGNFSSHTLSSPVALVAGQQAIVTVTYTFSAA
jgi:hypothetical protein